MKRVLFAVAMAGVAGLGALASATPSFAQGLECSCVTLAANGGPVGQIASADGEVLSSGGNGLGSAGAGAPLYAGSQVVIGPQSSANINVGSCVLPVGANSEVTIIETGSNLCVQVVEVPPGLPPYVPVIAGGTLVVGGIGLAASGGGDSPASP